MGGAYRLADSGRPFGVTESSDTTAGLDAITACDSISLEEVDRRAALQQRVDRKYVLGLGQADELVRRLCDDHDVLEIEGRRRFAYESLYYDTADLTTYRDHIAGRKPRFKARVRCYTDTGTRVFEVKIKRESDETAKESIDLDEDPGPELPDTARRLLERTLNENGYKAEGIDLRPTLCTRFTRVTLAARDEPERLTIDIGLRMEDMDGRSVQIKDDTVVLETKTGDGEGRADRLLRDQETEETSLSKYRVGVGLLSSLDADRDYLTERARLFRALCSSSIRPSSSSTGGT